MIERNLYLIVLVAYSEIVTSDIALLSWELERLRWLPRSLVFDLIWAE